MAKAQLGAKHKRSRKGCYTCRRRKKRCDEVKPVCTACQRLSLDCSYPVEHLGFNNKGISGSPGGDASTAPCDPQSWISHPQMTHFDLFNANKDIPSLSHSTVTIEPPEYDSIPNMHFPLHFSRVDKTPSSSVGTAIEVDRNPTVNTPSSLDFDSARDDSRDCLTPLLHHISDYTDIRSLNNSSGITSETSEYACVQEFGPPVNLTVGDELPVPFPTQGYFAEGSTSMDEAMEASTLEAAPILSQNLQLNKNSNTIDQTYVSPGPSTAMFRKVYPGLDENAIGLFIYFRDKQSILMSVSPLNYFRSVFLAFSLRYRVIMYGILAWAAWHQGNQEEVARHFFEKASTLIRRETINSRSKEEILAAVLILASAKICSGDNNDWRPYLILAGEIIHLHGGLTSFMESESVRWLLKNFAYHEILSSSSLNMPKLFSANDFELIFHQPSSEGLPDTLCACCQTIFVKLERINELTRSLRLLLLSDNKEKISSSTHGMDIKGKDEPSQEEIERIYMTAHGLEEKIWALQPAHKILQHLSERDLRLQLTLFDIFKLVAVLHLYQSVLRVNSASLSMRVVASRLDKSIDGLLGTMVEGILIFPLFILGISSTTYESRQRAINRFKGMSSRLCARNVSRALALVEKVWDRDNFGQTYVDWNDLVESEGLHFSFS